MFCAGSWIAANFSQDTKVATIMSEALSLYRSIIRSSKQLPYNFRMYAKRRAKDSFLEHRNLSDSRQIQEVFQNGLEELRVLRRQGTIHDMFHTDPLVVEVY